MHAETERDRARAIRAEYSSIWFAVISLVRGIPLFFSTYPGTPLRVLCIVAFDVLFRLRHGGPLPRDRVRLLAAFLDFGACANRIFDDKALHRDETRQARGFLRERRRDELASEYLRRLSALEHARPRLKKDKDCFRQTQEYREAVVRLSLGMASTVADLSPGLDEAIRETRGETDLQLMFRLAMQCQIIDDVVDYVDDRAGGLPGFLTASGSLPTALEMTRNAADAYADVSVDPGADRAFALRAALALVSIATRVAIILRSWTHRMPGDPGVATRRFPASAIVRKQYAYLLRNTTAS